MLREEVEICPYCDGENILQHDVEKDGYKVKCQHCGEEIMLCDACLNSEDNEGQFCNWSEHKGCWRSRKESLISMLHQNWFMDERFEMFEEYAESQSFYDTETGNIYVVFEEYGMKGSTIIQEITPESMEYAPNIARYNEWKQKEFVVTFSAHILSLIHI